MERTFSLLYHMNGGITDVGLEAMPRHEQDWLLRRLRKQREEENKKTKPE